MIGMWVLRKEVEEATPGISLLFGTSDTRNTKQKGRVKVNRRRDIVVMYLEPGVFEVADHYQAIV